ncbi:hypothetical protein [Gemmatimonas sp.]|nr:hypothetical protein [Gemmatimonas sp.]
MKLPTVMQGEEGRTPTRVPEESHLGEKFLPKDTLETARSL